MIAAGGGSVVGSARYPFPTTTDFSALLVQAAAARKGKPEESDSAKLLREEQELLRNITSQKALKGVKELAKVRAWLSGPHLHNQLLCYIIFTREKASRHGGRYWA